MGGTTRHEKMRTEIHAKQGFCKAATLVLQFMVMFNHASLAAANSTHVGGDTECDVAAVMVF